MSDTPTRPTLRPMALHRKREEDICAQLAAEFHEMTGYAIDPIQVKWLTDEFRKRVVAWVQGPVGLAGGRVNR